MPNHRNVYISLVTSMSKTGKFQLTPLVLPSQSACTSNSMSSKLSTKYLKSVAIHFPSKKVAVNGKQLSCNCYVTHSDVQTAAPIMAKIFMF